MGRFPLLALATLVVSLHAPAISVAQEQSGAATDSSSVMQATTAGPYDGALSQMEGYVIAMPARQRLPNSLVLLRSGERYRTDLNGHFEFTRLTPGRRDVMIVTPGCRVSFTTVALDPWQTRRVGFTVDWNLDVQATEARRRSAEGLLVTSEEIDEMQVRSLSEVVRRVAPDMVGRGRTMTAQDRTPVVVINGVRAVGPSAMREIRPQDVAYVEILKGASGGWSYGSEGASGVIKIATKLGMETDAPRMDPELCELPDWP